MGDGKRRRERLAQANPHCIYCGGAAKGVEIEHMPPRVMFRNRHRPKGLEFLACSDCNRGSRIFDLVAGFFCRLGYDPTTAAEEAEFKALVAAVNNNVPGLGREMMVPSPEIREEWRLNRHLFPPGLDRPMYAGGPILNGHMKAFAAKLGFALHTHITGNVVPMGGALSAGWYTNAKLMTGDVPHHVIEILGPIQTLRQGRLQIGDQFEYRSFAAFDGTCSVHFAHFRYTFAVEAVVWHEGRLAQEARGLSVFHPGFLLAGTALPSGTD